MPPGFFNLLNPDVLFKARSTVLSTLAWILFVLVVALLWCVTVKADLWIEIFFAVFIALDVVALLSAFAYYSIMDPAALRSERFAIRKYALEQRLFGDDQSALFEDDEVRQTIEGVKPAELRAPDKDDKDSQ